MTDRENSPAYQMLPRSARRVFAAIERAIGDRSSASVSYTEFRFDHHIGRQSISPSVKLLDHLGLIDIEPGPRLINIFRLSNRWRCIDEVEAVRLAELAREAMTQRRFERAKSRGVTSNNGDVGGKPRDGADVRSSPPKPNGIVGSDGTRRCMTRGRPPANIGDVNGIGRTTGGSVRISR